MFRSFTTIDSFGNYGMKILQQFLADCVQVCFTLFYSVVFRAGFRVFREVPWSGGFIKKVLSSTNEIEKTPGSRQ